MQLELSTEDRRSSVESSSFSLRLLLVRLGAALVLLCLGLTTACTKERVEVKNLDVNPDSLYTARMLQLNTLISDSGLVRYRMTAPVLLIYERPERNEWVFPKGLLLRPYDASQGSQVFIKADSAVRRTEHEEWSATSRCRAPRASASAPTASSGSAMPASSIRGTRPTSLLRVVSSAAHASRPPMTSAGTRSRITRGA